MQTAWKQENRREWAGAVLLIAILGGLSYLLLAHQFGFYFDDWYLAYTGKAAGSAGYFNVFAIDRPFRAYFVGAVFDLFGLRAPLYSYLSYLLRVTGALGAFWLIRQVWPRQKQFAVVLSVLFVIYPGWTDQPAAFDYQSHLLSLALMIFSLALTVKAIFEVRWAPKIAWVGLAVVFQVVSLLLMEYYIGMEGLRLVLMAYLLLGHSPRAMLRPGWPARLKTTLITTTPYLLGAAGFMLWRTFIFSNTRDATDIGGMISGVIQSPARRGLWALISLFRDYFNVSLLAWFVPLYNTAYKLDLRPSLIAILVGLVSAGFVWLGVAWLRRFPPAAAQEDCPQDGLDMFWIGSLGVIFALIPVALGERNVVFGAYSRFSLPASMGAVLVVGGLLIAFTREWLRTLVPILLVGFACIFHYSNAQQFADHWQVMREFWWQVSWRIPQITPGTALAVEYADAPIVEDYVIWGPANLIYYPQGQSKEGLIYTPIGGVLLTPDAILDITLKHSRWDRMRRGLLSPQDLDQILVISMPTAGSCAEVIDGRAPELSDRSSSEIFRVAPYSRMETVLAAPEHPAPPADLYGPEPAHTWCYYYQKAALARQLGDWETIARLGDEAQARDLRPAEWVEWMPFAQAYAYLARYDQVDRIVQLYWGVPFLRHQACDLFKQDAYGYAQQFATGQAYLQTQFCK